MTQHDRNRNQQENGNHGKKRVTIETDTGMYGRQFDEQARWKALDLLETLPWGDAGCDGGGIDGLLDTLLEATETELAEWKALHLNEQEGEITPEQVAAMTPEEKLRYVAVLVRYISWNWRGERGDEPKSLAGLLHGLYELAGESGRLTYDDTGYWWFRPAS